MVKMQKGRSCDADRARRIPSLLRGSVEDCVASKDILIVFVSPKKNNIIYCNVVKSARVVSLRLSESLYIRVI